MRTAVVILNWNGRHWLQRFLPDVQAHSAGAEIVVADNGSTDGSLSWLKEHYPTITRLDLGRNHGFAGGYNEALDQVNADRYLLLNSDVAVTEGWLDRLNAYLEQHPEMAACQPKVLDHARPDHFEHAGAAGGYIDRNGYPFCRGRIFEITETDSGQYDDAREVFWATGACMLIRAEAFHSAGGFDADLFAHMEEIDLCWRLRRQGWTIGYTPTAVVYHVGGGSLGYGSPRKTYLNFRNSLIVLSRNLNVPFWWVQVLRRLLLDGAAAAKFLVEGHGKHTWQVARAHCHFFAMLPRVIRQRRQLMRTERTPTLTGLYHRSVAYDRFILGWKQFGQLDPAAFEPARSSK